MRFLPQRVIKVILAGESGSSKMLSQLADIIIMISQSEPQRNVLSG